MKTPLPGYNCYYQTLCLNRYIQTKCSDLHRRKLKCHAARWRFSENGCYKNLGKLQENIHGGVKLQDVLWLTGLGNTIACKRLAFHTLLW